MDAFRIKDYTNADSLFQKVLAHDSGYYFVRNFIDAIHYSSEDGALKLQKLLNGKRFIAEENENMSLEFSFNDDVFQVNIAGGVPHTVYPVGDNLIMDSFNKDYKFEVTGDEENIACRPARAGVRMSRRARPMIGSKGGGVKRG